MVGPPKTLQDLRRIEGAVRITCWSCQKAHLRDREELIAERRFSRRPCDWPTVRGDLTCHHCSSADVRVEAVPFGEGTAELRAHRARMLVMNLAIEVLRDAAERARTEQVGTPAVRLALRVLHPLVGDQAVLATFWNEATAANQHPWSGAQQSLRWIVQRLLDRGYPVWAELR